MNEQEIEKEIIKALSKYGLETLKTIRLFKGWAIDYQRALGHSVGLGDIIEEAIGSYARSLVEVPK